MHTFATKPVDFYKKAISCANHYGFLSIDELDQILKEEAASDPEARPIAKQVKYEPVLEQKHKKVDATSRDFEAALKQLTQKNITPGKRPLLFYTSNLDLEALKGGAPLPKTVSFSLHALGMKHSIAEALIVKTARAILDDAGEKETFVALNSIGCRDSSAKFVREATAQLRKHLGDLPPTVGQAFKEDVFLAYKSLFKRSDAPEDLPRPMEFLSSVSRKHLREVLEFFEAAEIPYIFDDRLLGHRDCYTQTIFEIKPVDEEAYSIAEQEESVAYARGGRYDELAKRYFKTNTPAVGISFTCKPETTTKIVIQRVTLPRTTRKPRVFFIQLGYAAQLKSLAIIETLRKARIPLEQNLDGNRLSDQLAYAESLAIPYTVIMGQKEALEGNVIVRDTTTRAQQTVAVDMLPIFFKTAK